MYSIVETYISNTLKERTTSVPPRKMAESDFPTIMNASATSAAPSTITPLDKSELPAVDANQKSEKRTSAIFQADAEQAAQDAGDGGRDSFAVRKDLSKVSIHSEINDDVFGVAAGLIDENQSMTKVRTGKSAKSAGFLDEEGSRASLGSSGNEQLRIQKSITARGSELDDSKLLGSRAAKFDEEGIARQRSIRKTRSDAVVKAKTTVKLEDVIRFQEELAMLERQGVNLKDDFEDIEIVPHNRRGSVGAGAARAGTTSAGAMRQNVSLRRTFRASTKSATEFGLDDREEESKSSDKEPIRKSLKSLKSGIDLASKDTPKSKAGAVVLSSLTRLLEEFKNSGAVTAEEFMERILGGGLLVSLQNAPYAPPWKAQSAYQQADSHLKQDAFTKWFEKKEKRAFLAYSTEERKQLRKYFLQLCEYDPAGVASNYTKNGKKPVVAKDVLCRRSTTEQLLMSRCPNGQSLASAISTATSAMGRSGRRSRAGRRGKSQVGTGHVSRHTSYASSMCCMV